MGECASKEKGCDLEEEDAHLDPTLIPGFSKLDDENRSELMRVRDDTAKMMGLLRGMKKDLALQQKKSASESSFSQVYSAAPPPQNSGPRNRGVDVVSNGETHHELGIRNRMLNTQSSMMIKGEARLHVEGDDIPTSVNVTLVEMWPFISKFVTNMLKDKVQPAVQKAMPGPLSDIHFVEGESDLGKSPMQFRFMRAKAASQTTNDKGVITNVQIIADLEYNSDLNIQLRASSGLVKMGVTGIRIAGTLVIGLVHLLPRPPFFAGMRVYFVNPPSVDVDLSGLGGLLNIGTIKNKVQTVIMEQISNACVLPKRIGIAMDKEESDIFRIKAPRPEGVLDLTVVEAKGLSLELCGTDGTCDPYCEIVFAGQVVATKHVKESRDPTWGKTFTFIVDSKQAQELLFTVLDEDEAWITGSKSTNLLGKGTVGVEALLKSPDVWWPLSTDDGSGKDLGKIHFRATWRPFSLRKDIDPNNKALLFIGLYGAHELPRLQRGQTDPKHYATVALSDDKIEHPPQETAKVDAPPKDVDVEGRKQTMERKSALLFEKGLTAEEIADMLDTEVDTIEALNRIRSSQTEAFLDTSMESAHHVLWEAPFNFLLEKPSSTKIEITIWREVGAGTIKLGIFKMSVDELLQNPKHSITFKKPVIMESDAHSRIILEARIQLRGLQGAQ